MLKWSNMEDIKLNATLGEGAREGGGSFLIFILHAAIGKGAREGGGPLPDFRKRLAVVLL